MPLIATVKPENADADVKEIFDASQQAFGGVPDAFQLLAASPHQLQTQFHNIGYYMAHPNLSGELLAMVRMLVAEAHDCPYCVDLNAGFLIQMGADPEALRRARQDPLQAPLSEREKDMLILILMAVNKSAAVSEQDLALLRNHGYSERDILDGIAHGANALAVDLIFNALKLQPLAEQRIP